MYDNYNYPMGADTPSAPWNEVSIPEREFDIEVTQTMHFRGTVWTSNYNPIMDDEDGHVEYDTFDTPWSEIFSDQHYSVKELLGKLKEYAQDELSVYDEMYKAGDRGHGAKREQLRRIIEDCDLWECTEEEII